MKKTNEELRKSICAGLKMADRRTLKMINALLTEYYAPDDGEDEKELIQELDKRLKAYKTGQSQPSVVEDALVRLRKRNKRR